MTTTTEATLTRSNLQPFVDAQWVTARRHPELPLTIYNYAPRCVYAKHWTPETLACRGLALADDDTIVLRPFGKFFNAGELDAMPTGFHNVYEKMDGSLFLLGTYDGQLVTATRGSFTSPQATIGRRIIEEMDWVLNTGLTWCFELITPSNRIVVDYGDDERLVLLAVMDNGTGNTMTDHWPPFEAVTYYRAETMQAILADPVQQKNREGFVLHFPVTDQRVKIKFDEYVRLHRVLTGVNERHIWEILSKGESLDPLLELVPDEFYQWVKDTKRGLLDDFEIVRETHLERFEYLRGSRDRKTFADRAKSTSDGYNLSILFHLYDGKPIDQIIWKQIRPESVRSFRSDES